MLLGIKNMVCDRCIKSVKSILTDLNLDFLEIELGKVRLTNELNDKKHAELSRKLIEEGFELMVDIETQLILGVKYIVIMEIHNNANRRKNNSFGSLISQQLEVKYSYISKLFSRVEGRTIENFIISQKIERAKELMSYGELNISEVSYELSYSSPQHFARQFKNQTGMTPTEFKTNGSRQKLDKI